jgi:hypothetical protein
MESSIGSIVWRGDADYYRRRLASDFTYDTLLEMTAHSYVMALENNPFLDMRNHATYLSTVFADVSIERARTDMARTIAEWLDDGVVSVPDDMLLMADAGQIVLPFEVPSFTGSQPTGR